MQLREYNSERDFQYIRKWIADERGHAMWCARLFPYPIEFDSFHATLKRFEEEWGDIPYVLTDNDDVPVGFFAFSINKSDNSGFFKFIIVDSQLRGKGYGTKMLQMMQEKVFEEEKLSCVKLNVYDVNTGARKCYEKAGFVCKDVTPDAMQFAGESWGRVFMVAEKIKNSY